MIVAWPARRLLAWAFLLMGTPAPAVETVRIAMGAAHGSVSIHAERLEYGEDKDDEAQATWVPVEANATVRLLGENLEVNGRVFSELAVRFRTGSESLPVKVGSWEVKGQLVVRRVGRRLQLINVLPLEDYLSGVLGAEMPPNFPAEALKAQAVAARTFALHRKLETYGEAYHLGSSVLDQVYKGLLHDDPRTRAAVEATRGEVLTYDLAPAEAYFHASCGGRTESGREALGRDLPYLHSVDCPCGQLSQSHWELTLRPEDLASLEMDKELAVASRSPTGRALSLRMGRRTLDAVTFRQRLGYERVRSLAFDVEPESGAFHLKGRGNGHGAGLCQLGAKIFAERGWSYQQILAHYYPGTELQPLY